uniref:Dirigent protein n=1 Tax=Populus alba TaxID=43335 RepID=A0A4U5R5E6_POPAL|nr:hypothetical protein D5086_0000016960 [Populus alba]
MEIHKILSATNKAIACILFLTLAIAFTTSARILDEQPEHHNNNPTAASTSAGATITNPGHTLSFFMHDILGGTNPSTRAVTGIVSNPAVTGQVPFAKPNGANLPITNGLMFGTITAIDDEITEGHDLGSGFYRVVFMLIALAFSGFTEQEFPSLSLLSWVALSESMLCFGVLAVVKDNPSVNQHATDGVETLLEFAVYVSY